MENKHLKIAMFCLHSSPVDNIGTRDTGGMSVYVHELSKEMARSGHSVDIYTRTHFDSSPQIIHNCKNIRIIHLPVQDSNLLSKIELYPLLPEFLTCLENFRLQDKISYDLIYSHYWLSGILGDLAQALWKVPHLIMFHTLGALKNSFQMEQQEPELRISTEKKLAEQSHGIIMACERERKNLMLYYGVPSEKISIVPCGVEFNIFRPIDRHLARLNLGLALDEKVILYVGRFDPLKGIDRLIEAFSLLASEQSVRLVIVGENGCPGPLLKKQMDDLGVQKRVSFFERVDQNLLADYYSAADVLAIPSRYESFGLVALESLACGTPVVATPVGNMENIICEGETGRVTSDFSPRSIAEALNFFISSENNISPEAIRSSIAEYTWSSSASGVLDVFYNIILKHNNKRFTSKNITDRCSLRNNIYEK